jgi:hypothetical protein
LPLFENPAKTLPPDGIKTRRNTAHQYLRKPPKKAMVATITTTIVTIKIGGFRSKGMQERGVEKGRQMELGAERGRGRKKNRYKRSNTNSFCCERLVAQNCLYFLLFLRGKVDPWEKRLECVCMFVYADASVTIIKLIFIRI